MKKLVKVEEVEGEGLVGLMGQQVTLFCQNYFYTGVLVGVNAKFVKLENSSIVYETGGFSDAKWGNAEKLPHDVYVMVHAIEAFTVIDKS